MFPRIVLLTFVVAILGGLGYGLSRLVTSRQPLPQATALIAAHDPKAAQLLLRPLVRAEPRNAEAHVLLARTQLDLNDPLAAEKELKIARALRYERLVLNPLLARAYILQRRYAEIIADIPALGARPEETAANLALRAVAYAHMNDLRQASAALDQAERLGEADTLIRLARARVLLAGAEPGPALALADGVLTAEPANTEAMLLRGDALAQLGRADDALAAITAAVDIVPYSVLARVQRANQLIAMDQDARAQLDVDAGFQVDWHDVPLNMTAALLKMRAGRLGDAQTQFQSQLASYETFPRGYYYLAMTATLGDQFESALDMLAKFRKLRPDDHDGLRLRGLLEQKLGRAAASAEFLQRLTQAAPRDAQGFDLLGRAYFMLGRTQEAIAAYATAAGLEPGNRAYATHLEAARIATGSTAAPEPVPVAAQ